MPLLKPVCPRAWPTSSNEDCGASSLHEVDIGSSCALAPESKTYVLGAMHLHCSQLSEKELTSLRVRSKPSLILCSRRSMTVITPSSSLYKRHSKALTRAPRRLLARSVAITTRSSSGFSTELAQMVNAFSCLSIHALHTGGSL